MLMFRFSDRSGCSSAAVDRIVKVASLARETPGVYVVEDAHWIDEVSESMLAEFLTVVPQTHSLVLIPLPPRISGRVDPGGRCANHSPSAPE